MSEENPVRVIDVFVDELDLGALGFAGVVPEAPLGSALVETEARSPRAQWTQRIC